MPQSKDILTLTVVAAAAVTAESFGTLGGATATAGGNAAGVFRSDGATGDHVPLDVLGTAVVQAGGAIGVDAGIEVGPDGKAVAHDEGELVARAVTEAAADGDRIEILMIPN